MMLKSGNRPLSCGIGHFAKYCLSSYMCYQASSYLELPQLVRKFVAASQLQVKLLYKHLSHHILNGVNKYSKGSFGPHLVPSYFILNIICDSAYRKVPFVENICFELQSWRCKIKISQNMVPRLILDLEISHLFESPILSCLKDSI